MRPVKCGHARVRRGPVEVYCPDCGKGRWLDTRDLSPCLHRSLSMHFGGDQWPPSLITCGICPAQWMIEDVPLWVLDVLLQPFRTDVLDLLSQP